MILTSDTHRMIMPDLGISLDDNSLMFNQISSIEMSNFRVNMKFWCQNRILHYQISAHEGWVYKIIASAYIFPRLILDADNMPIVVPFVHTGMQEVMPVGAKFPRVGKTVSTLFCTLIKFAWYIFLHGSCCWGHHLSKTLSYIDKWAGDCTCWRSHLLWWFNQWRSR